MITAFCNLIAALIFISAAFAAGWMFGHYQRAQEQAENTVATGRVLLLDNQQSAYAPGRFVVDENPVRVAEDAGAHNTNPHLTDTDGYATAHLAAVVLL